MPEKFYLRRNQIKFDTFELGGGGRIVDLLELLYYSIF